MKEGKYAKTLAKIQVRALFRIKVSGETFTIEKFVGRRHAGAHPYGHEHVGR